MIRIPLPRIRGIHLTLVGVFFAGFLVAWAVKNGKDEKKLKRADREAEIARFGGWDEAGKVMIRWEPAHPQKIKRGDLWRWADTLDPEEAYIALRDYSEDKAPEAGPDFVVVKRNKWGEHVFIPGVKQ